MATKTETNIKNFKINYLTKEQYEAALASGDINQDEVYMTPAEDVPSKMSDLVDDVGYLTEHQDISGKLDKTGDGSNVISNFTTASTRTNITAGEKLSTLFGKIAKWLSDLKTVAFTGSYNDLSNKPTIPTVTNDLTNTLKSHYDAAYTHSQTDHAPANAQENIIETIKVNGTTQTVTNKSVNIAVPDEYVHPTFTSHTNGLYKISTTTEGHVGSATTVTKSDITALGIPAQDTVYTHPTYTSRTSGLYKITVNGTGHVSGATAVTKSDITALGIPAQDTVTTVDSALSTTSTNPIQNKIITSRIEEVDARIDAITDGADTALDTFKEVKEYLDNHQDEYQALAAISSNKVDKVSGKGLSTNDYTTTEKNKLAGIATGAEVNQNTFSNIVVGSSTIVADSKTDTLTLVAGSNVTLTPDTTNDKVTIAAKDTTYSNATTSTAGLMSTTDKTKLDGVESNAQENVIEIIKVNGTSQTISNKVCNISVKEVTVDAALDSSSENPVQNKIVAAYFSNVENELDTKVDKVTGKGLSTNDFTTDYMIKLAGIGTGAQKNQNTFTTVSVDGTYLVADEEEDYLILKSGDGITLTPNVDVDQVTISLSNKPSVYFEPYTTTTEGQTEFTISLSTFNTDTDMVQFISGRTTLSPEVDYTITGSTITLSEGLPLGRTVGIWIYHNMKG